MEPLPLAHALLLGIVEGLTEFLPVSSTGHLIVAGSLVGYTGERAKVFELAIQSGAMLAVVWEYRARFGRAIGGLASDPAARRFAFNLAVAFVPAGALGFLFGSWIQRALFSPVPVAVAFVAGALVILWAERRQRVDPRAVRVNLTPLAGPQGCSVPWRPGVLMSVTLPQGLPWLDRTWTRWKPDFFRLK